MAMAFVLAACNGPAADGDVEGARDDTKDADVARDDAGNSAPDDVQDEADDRDDADDGRSDVPDELMKLLAPPSSYKISYRATVAGQTSEFTMFYKGERFRYDMEAEGVESRAIMTEGELISCTNQGSWRCMLLGDGQQDDSMPAQDVPKIEADSLDDYSWKKLPDRTVAGTKATCYEFTMDSLTEEVCYSKDAVPLYVKVTEPELYVMEATSYSTKVSDSDFEPPAEPQSIDDMMKGFDPSAYGVQ